MDIFQVPPTHIDLAWKDGASKLGEACKWAAREITEDQLKMLLSRGERTLLGAKEGDKIIGWAAVQVHQLPNIRVLYIYSLAGKGIATAEGMEQLREYARANGCTSIRGAVRPQMQRMLQMLFKAKPIYMTIEMEST